jgi:hypothetical protein
MYLLKSFLMILQFLSELTCGKFCDYRGGFWNMWENAAKSSFETSAIKTAQTK